MLEYKRIRTRESDLLTVVRREFYDNLPDTYTGGIVCISRQGHSRWYEYSKIKRLYHDDAMLDAYNMLDDYMQTCGDMITVCDTILEK